MSFREPNITNSIFKPIHRFRKTAALANESYALMCDTVYDSKNMHRYTITLAYKLQDHVTC